MACRSMGPKHAAAGRVNDEGGEGGATRRASAGRMTAGRCGTYAVLPWPGRERLQYGTGCRLNRRNPADRHGLADLKLVATSAML
jgi:hypothetical protein